MRMPAQPVSPVVSESPAAIGGNRPHPLAALALAVVASMPAVAAVLHGGVAPLDAERTMTHGGRTRTYLVRDFGRDGPAPVVIVLHGGGGHAENAARMTGFDRVAAREGVIAVYPNGTAARDRDRLLTWNAGHCCAAAMRDDVDDVGFIGAIVDALVASKRADASRVFVTGMSNGAMMAHRLGRELSGKLAGIAPVVGAVFGDETPPRGPVPAFVVVGADDRVVPPAGGPLTLRLLLGLRPAADRDVAPAIAQAAYWAHHNGCAEPTHSETAAYRKAEWTGCRIGASVVFVSVAGNGHAWPGGEPGRAGAAPPTKAFDASEAMWAFFRTLPARR
jgi:polyhydroxybutyrate depolymerase